VLVLREDLTDALEAHAGRVGDLALGHAAARVGFSHELVSLGLELVELRPCRGMTPAESPKVSQWVGGGHALKSIRLTPKNLVARFTPITSSGRAALRTPPAMAHQE
jgi:hypothetical protein